MNKGKTKSGSFARDVRSTVPLRRYLEAEDDQVHSAVVRTTSSASIRPWSPQMSRQGGVIYSRAYDLMQHAEAYNAGEEPIFEPY